MTLVPRFIFLACLAIIIFGTGYLYWFKAEEYTDQLVKGIKDWMPFAHFYRRHLFGVCGWE